MELKGRQEVLHLLQEILSPSVDIGLVIHILGLVHLSSHQFFCALNCNHDLVPNTRVQFLQFSNLQKEMDFQIISTTF